MDFLEKARSFGTYLIVGLYDDDVSKNCLPVFMNVSVSIPFPTVDVRRL